MLKSSLLYPQQFDMHSGDHQMYQRRYICRMCGLVTCDANWHASLLGTITILFIHIISFINIITPWILLFLSWPSVICSADDFVNEREQFAHMIPSLTFYCINQSCDIGMTCRNITKLAIRKQFKTLRALYTDSDYWGSFIDFSKRDILLVLCVHTALVRLLN